MTSPKAARIWKRTIVGSSITAVLVALLWLANLDPLGRPMLAIGAVLTAISVFEIGRMGALAGRGLAWILAVPMLSVVFAEFAALGAPESRPALFAVYERVLLTTVVAHGLIYPTRTWGRWRVRVALLAVVVAGVWLWRAVERGDANFEARPLVLAAAVLVVFTSFARGAHSRRELALAIGLAVWVIVPLPTLVRVWLDFGERGLVALIVLSKIGDNAGYFFGNWLGRHHPFPSISPGKTTEGCVASFVAGVLAGVGVVAFGLLEARADCGAPAWLVGALAGASINLAAQAGDLFESWVKRRAGVKDASTWFGPSGGMLDLVDSLLFSVPMALCTWPAMFSAISGARV